MGGGFLQWNFILYILFKLRCSLFFITGIAINSLHFKWLNHKKNVLFKWRVSLVVGSFWTETLQGYPDCLWNAEHDLGLGKGGWLERKSLAEVGETTIPLDHDPTLLSTYPWLPSLHSICCLKNLNINSPPPPQLYSICICILFICMYMYNQSHII